MVAIATEDDGYTIIELLSSWDLEVGDTLSWKNGYGLGSETYENLSRRNKKRSLCPESFCHKNNLESQLRL